MSVFELDNYHVHKEYDSSRVQFILLKYVPFYIISYKSVTLHHKIVSELAWGFHLFSSVKLCNCFVPAGGCGDPSIGSGVIATVSGTAVGDTVTSTCPPGGIFYGSSSRTCQTNGYWSGDIPTCR